MLRARILKTFLDRGLIDRGAHILVACSGGADSATMLHALHSLKQEMGFTLVVASIDHGLRNASPDEVAFVARYSEELGLPFYSERLSLDKTESSLQARARKARYEALFRIAKSAGASTIAVGHTLDDQAETVLSRILRGASARSLCGVLPRRTDGVIRPLIDCTRQMVHDYASHHDIGFVSDSSNFDTTYERIRIRQEILPRLAQENPQVACHLAALADEMQDWSRYIDKTLDAIDVSETTLPVAVFSAHPLRRQIVRRWLIEHECEPASRAQFEDILRLQNEKGEVRLAGGRTVVWRQSALLLVDSGDQRN